MKKSSLIIVGVILAALIFLNACEINRGLIHTQSQPIEVAEITCNIIERTVNSTHQNGVLSIRMTPKMWPGKTYLGLLRRENLEKGWNFLINVATENIERCFSLIDQPYGKNLTHVLVKIFKLKEK